MVQRSPPLTQITVIHHHHGNDYLCIVMVKVICLDAEERLLQMSYDKNSPLSDPPELPTASLLNFDDKNYRTVSVTKDGGHLGFSVKVICSTLPNKVISICHVI